MFFNSGLIMDDFKVEGKVPVVMERFTIERIVGDNALEGGDNSFKQRSWRSNLRSARNNCFSDCSIISSALNKFVAKRHLIPFANNYCVDSVNVRSSYLSCIIILRR